MTDEELDRLIKEAEEQVSQLPDENKRLNWAEQKQKSLVLGRARVLKKIKEARREGNFRQETRATLEYNLLVNYGHKNALLYNFMRARMTGWMWW